MKTKLMSLALSAMLLAVAATPVMAGLRNP